MFGYFHGPLPGNIAITVASQIPASRLFIKAFVHAQMKDNINAPVTGEFPAQRPRNGERDSIEDVIVTENSEFRSRLSMADTV